MTIIFIFFLGYLVLFSGNSTAFGYSSDDTYLKIQEMVNDLGAPPDRAKNNGKVQQCVEGGTKKITIKKSKSSTTYEGIYKKCKEYGRIRDGEIIITIGN